MRMLWLLVPVILCAQQAATPPPAGPPAPPKEPTEREKEELEAGIPITSEVVKKTCSPCHKTDDKGRMSRISWRRTTPEGWEFTVKRMIGLNNLQIEPADARE